MGHGPTPPPTLFAWPHHTEVLATLVFRTHTHCTRLGRKPLWISYLSGDCPARRRHACVAWTPRTRGRFVNTPQSSSPHLSALARVGRPASIAHRPSPMHSMRSPPLSLITPPHAAASLMHLLIYTRKSGLARAHTHTHNHNHHFLPLPILSLVSSAKGVARRRRIMRRQLRRGRIGLRLACTAQLPPRRGEGPTIGRLEPASP